MKHLIYLYVFVFYTTLFSQNNHLTCVSFNVRYDNPADTYTWNHRKENISKLFRDTSPDIIGMQEVLENQLSDLSKSLPDYQHIGVARDDGKNQGEYCPIFFKKERFKPISSGTFWLSQTPNKVSMGWDAACHRIVSWAKLLDNQSHTKILFVNTHLDHLGVIAQREGAKLISQWIKNNSNGEKVILSGDFNINDTSEAYRIIANDSSLILNDTHKVAQNKVGVDYSFHNFGKIELSQRQKIDFIFVDKTFTVKMSNIISETSQYGIISDHNLVLVELNF